MFEDIEISCEDRNYFNELYMSDIEINEDYVTEEDLRLEQLEKFLFWPILVS